MSNENNNEVVEVIEEKAENPKEASSAKRNKLAIAKEKIEQAKVVTADTKGQIEECMKNIDADIAVMDTQKQTLFDTALNPGEKLLESLGVEGSLLGALPSSQVELLDLDDEEVDIKELSSGRLKGFFWALIIGLAALAGWCYTAAKALGMTIPPEKIPDLARANKALEWTSEQIGQGANANIGAAVVIVALLLLMWIVYAVVTFSRASKNLRVASETEEAVSLYCASKEECKEKMKLVREHIQNSTSVLSKYTVLLEEQNAKTKRAILVEDVDAFENLHANSKADISNTQHLIAAVKKLLESPVSEEGVLTSEAVESLKQANKSLSDHIVRLYK